MKLKRLVGMITACVMLVSVVNANAMNYNFGKEEETVLYLENFESYDVNTAGGWTSPAGSVTVKEEAGNKYLALTSTKNGTARSAYKEIAAVNENFVLEADIKTAAFASNVSAFEVLENKGSLYMNHGCYSNGEYVFKMNRPRGLNRYVINNSVSDSGLALENYSQPASLTKEIPDEWLHLKVIGNFNDKTATAYLTSLDGKAVYYHGKTDMSDNISSFSCMAMLAPSMGVDTCIDNIEIRKAGSEDLAEEFYTVTINSGIDAFSQYVYKGDTAVNIPDVSVYGEHFSGWRVNGAICSAKELENLAINSDSEVTAVISPDYIEGMKTVEFNLFPADGELLVGEDNYISVKIIGELGTSLVTDFDERVKDYKIEWKFDGVENKRAVYLSEMKSKINFRIDEVAKSYNGQVTVTVTYNGKIMSVSKQLFVPFEEEYEMKSKEKIKSVKSDSNKFSFGMTSVSGYTKATQNGKGYSITGKCTQNADYISGKGFGFEAAVDAGEVYKVKATYEGVIRCEYINDSLSGFERKKESLDEDEFIVAVTGDGVLDITFIGEGKLSALEFEKVERNKTEKPSLWTIGDSTVQQNGSWGYMLNKNLENYPTLSGAIDKFYNSGRAGRNHNSYYTEGLFNNVLVGINPGDIVLISGMGTNDSKADKKTFKEYNNIYIDAIEAMGGYVILGSYTPTNNGYDVDYLMFNGKRNHAYDRAIREIYQERINAGDDKIIGFIDIGKISDILMTNDVRAVYNESVAKGKTSREARLAANAKAHELNAWWKDYNHYYVDFSNYILPEITLRLAQLIKGEEQSALPEIIKLSEEAMPASPASDSSFEVVSCDEYVDVSNLKMYGNTTYRMYFLDGSYKSVSAEAGKVHNTTGDEVIIVPEYKFEFTNMENASDPNIAGYVKVGANSYIKEKGYGLIDADYKINENGCRPENGKPIKVDVPKGYYDITIYRKGGVRADVYSEGVQIIQNTTSWGSQNRPSGSAVMHAPNVLIENGSADITFGNTSGNDERIASIELVRVPEKHRRSIVWVAGDSESANYYPINAEGMDIDSEKIMMTGFGMQLDSFLSDKYAVANFGQPSATAQSWNDEALEAVKRRMQKGDTILICFGINDGNKNVGIDNAKENIKKLVDAAKNAGATAILLSPVYNNKYQGKSYFTYSGGKNELEEYAKELGVEFIDVNRLTMKYVNDAIVETEDYNWVQNNYHVGDNLHLTQHSAMLVASIICGAMADMGYETTDYAYTYNDIAGTAVNESSNVIRGVETGVKRIYSVSEAKKLTEEALAPPEAESDILAQYTAPNTKWTFNAAKPAIEGANVPVISGSALWSEANGNIQFNADTTEAGKLEVNLEPNIENSVCIEFDLNVGALGGQVFEYAIVDNEGNSIINCSFDAYYHSGEVKVAGKTIIAGGEFVNNIPSARGDGMGAVSVQVKNTIDFEEGKVTVKIGNGEFKGFLTGFEKGVSNVAFNATRSKTAGRHIYLDNLSITELDTEGINPIRMYSDKENVYVALRDGQLIVGSYDSEGNLKEIKTAKENTVNFNKTNNEDGYITIFARASVDGKVSYINRTVFIKDIPERVQLVRDEKVAVPPVADLVIFMGQSNMAGRGEAENATVCPVGHGYEFRAVTAPDALYNVTGPFGKNENNSAVNDSNSKGADRRSGDMVSSIMESYYRKTGRPIVGVQCSRGGTDIRYWNSESVKNEAQARLVAAKNYLEAQGCAINKIFIVWCQGESDADRIHSGKQSVEAYKAGTIQVLEYMKEVGVEDMFIVKTGHYNGSDADGLHDAAYVALHNAQQALSEENENIYAVGSFLEYKDHMKDAFHYHQSAYNEVGIAVGNAIAEIYQ